MENKTNKHMNDTIKPANYLEDIGFWPSKSNIMRSYVIGFVVSILLTFVAYSIAIGSAGMSVLAIGVLILLACIQFFTQLVCFLHLGEGKSAARSLILLCVTVIVLILVIGSIWIMFTLNARQMPSEQQMEQYMNSQSGI